LATVFPEIAVSRLEKADEENVTKKLLLVFLAMATCLGLLFTSFSYFSDTEASTNNNFRVGTWAVDVEGSGNSASYVFQSLASGDNGTKTFNVTNTGTVSAYVDMSVGILENGTGHLGQYLMAHLYVSGGADIYGDAPIENSTGIYNVNLLLAAGESKSVFLDWQVSDGYSPFDINDKVVFTISFTIQPTP
jgi:predicted ribosomally synthesized peptide with SipW-like signal peptide